MMTKSETKRLEAKKLEYDKAYADSKRKWKRFTRGVKLEVRNMFNWYFFFQPKDSGDKVWHFIEVAIVDVILLRIFGLI